MKIHAKVVSVFPSEPQFQAHDGYQSHRQTNIAIYRAMLST